MSNNSSQTLYSSIESYPRTTSARFPKNPPKNYRTVPPSVDEKDEKDPTQYQATTEKEKVKKKKKKEDPRISSKEEVQ